MFLETDVIGSEQIEKRLEKLVGTLSVPKEILFEATSAVLNRIRTRFMQKVDIWNVPWEVSAAAAYREAHGGGGTGFDTGRLFRSIQIGLVADDYVTIGSDVEYGSFFHHGTSRQVARPFMGYNPDDILLVMQIAEKRIFEEKD